MLMSKLVSLMLSRDFVLVGSLSLITVNYKSNLDIQVLGLLECCYFFVHLYLHMYVQTSFFW